MLLLTADIEISNPHDLKSGRLLLAINQIMDKGLPLLVILGQIIFNLLICLQVWVLYIDFNLLILLIVLVLFQE
jgi:hypothetical protein